MNSIYNLVDPIYCINLISRDDKFEHMKKFEKKENITINYYRTIKDIYGGKIGCFKSYIEVIKHAFFK